MGNMKVTSIGKNRQDYTDNEMREGMVSIDKACEWLSEHLSLSLFVTYQDEDIRSLLNKKTLFAGNF